MTYCEIALFYFKPTVVLYYLNIVVRMAYPYQSFFRVFAGTGGKQAGNSSCLMLSGETYETMEDIFAALKSANISGVITDIITVSQYREQLAELNMQVRRVVDLPFEYGIVVVGDAAKLATEFKEYIRINSNTIKTQLQVPSDASEPVPTEDTTEQVNTLVPVLIGYLSVFLLEGNSQKNARKRGEKKGEGSDDGRCHS